VVQPGHHVPGGADININLDAEIVRTVLQFSYAYAHAENQTPDHTQFTINGVVFEPPSVPVLLQILSGKHSASQLLPAGSIYGLAPNKSVELTIPAGAVGGPVSIPCQHPASRSHHIGCA
jgi:iron transport multicopper oxidase